MSNPARPYFDSTGSFITYGDQRLERDLGVANGFPNYLMTPDDAIVSDALLAQLEIEEKSLINVNYDILKLVPAQFSDLENLIFDYNPTPNQPSKGQRLL